MIYFESKFDLNPPSGWDLWFAWRIYIRHCNNPLDAKRSLAFARRNGANVAHGWCPQRSGRNPLGCYVVQFKDPEYAR